MRRYEALKEITEILTDELVVCNLGDPSRELYNIKDRSENFYMMGSMGLSSSYSVCLGNTASRICIKPVVLKFIK